MKTTGYNSLKSWGIVAACSILYSVSMLPFRAAPIYYVAFLDRYATNRESASFVIIIPGVLKSLAGPVTGVLCEIFGLRALTVAGCFLSALGLALCFFAEDFALVTVFMGFIYGIGMALGTPLLPQAIKQHFQTNITSANGVFRAGGCILAFSVIPLVSYILDTYGCSGMLLLSGGIILQTVPMAMLLRDPKYSETKNSPGITFDTNLNLDNCKQNSVIDEANVENLLSKNRIEDLCKKSDVDATNMEKLLPTIHVGQNSESGSFAIQSIPKEEGNQLACVENGSINCNEPLKDGKSQLMTANALHPLLSPKNEHNQIFKRSSRFYSEVKKNKFGQACLTLSVLKDPSFAVMTISMSGISFVGFFVLPILNDYSRDKGIPKDIEHYFIMGYTLFQLVGFTCLGWLVDKGFMRISNYVAANCLGLGLTCCALRFSNSFATLFLATACFGIFSAALSSSVPTLIYEFIDTKMQTVAMSSSAILMAPLSFAIAPLIGYYREKLGYYDGALYLMTAVCAGCAALSFMLPYIEKCGKKKNDNSYMTTESP